MWFLHNAWLIWAFPAASFAIILLFGKKLPGKGWEIGVPAVALSFAGFWLQSSRVGTLGCALPRMGEVEDLIRLNRQLMGVAAHRRHVDSGHPFGLARG